MNARQHLPNSVGLAEAGCAFLEAFASRARLARPVRFAVDHALAEHLENVRNHSVATAVELQFDEDGVRLRIEICDDGHPFDPTAAPELDLGAPFDERPLGGLGIHLIRRFTDKMSYHWDGSRNHLVMIKLLECHPSNHAS